MADAEHDDHEDTPGYKAPAPKSVSEIVSADAEDDSLRKYKETLLGSVDNVGVEAIPDDPRGVIVRKCSLLVEGRPDMEMDLSGDVSNLKKQTFVLKEGTSYKVQIHFFVQREIVTGLKFGQKSYRKGIQVDKSMYMVGSYGPKKELQQYTTPSEEAPTGMLARGTYVNKSLFTDDDKTNHLKWEWTLEIAKDWK